MGFAGPSGLRVSRHWDFSDASASTMHGGGLSAAGRMVPALLDNGLSAVEESTVRPPASPDSMVAILTQLPTSTPGCCQPSACAPTEGRDGDAHDERDA